MTTGNFNPANGSRFATDRYDFEAHYQGTNFRHTADQIDLLDGYITIDSRPNYTVQQAIVALAAVTGGSGSAFIAGGDLGGTNTSQTVIGLNNIPINTNIAPSNNEVLIYDGGTNKWVPGPVPSSSISGTAGGDLSGTYPNPTVAKINGSSVPAGGSLTTGYVLQASGSNSLTYALVNLASSVTGTLPTANQANQSMGKDVSGTTNSATVIALQGNSISTTAPTSGQVLAWNSSTSKWTPTNSSSVTWANDLVGSSNTNQYIAAISGNAGGHSNVTVSASLVPTDATYSLGGSSNRWNFVYVADSIRWPSSFIPTQAGDIGMDTISGRPHVFIDGYDHGLTAWRAYFGDASDGTATCDGVHSVVGMSLNGSTYVLTRDCFFGNLTITGSTNVLLDGYRLFVNDTLNVGSSALIGVPGNSAPNNTGVAGLSTTTGTVLGGASGGTGSTGSGTNGTSVSNSFGGSGGAGGNGGGSDGAGGTASTPSVTAGSIHHSQASFGAIFSVGSGTGVWTPIYGGAGGGAGAGAASTTGGGGGGGGGVCIISTRVLTGNGTISVAGGNGGNASGSGNGDGGGGGGGGIIILIYGDKSNFTGAITTSGGVGGNGINSGHNGTSGSSGNVIYIPG